MKPDNTLSITSLLAIVLLSLHLTDDIIRGFDPIGPQNLTVVGILVVWLIGAIELVGRRSGYVILLLGSLFAAGMPVLHLRGTSIVAIAESPGGFFFVWTLFALGVTGTFSFLLAARGLWRLRRSRLA